MPDLEPMLVEFGRRGNVESDVTYVVEVKKT